MIAVLLVVVGPAGEREGGQGEKQFPHTIKGREANGIGHIWPRNYLLKHVIEGKIAVRVEVTVRRGRRRKHLLDDIKETRVYQKLKEEALDLTVCGTCFGRGCGTVVRQTTE